MSLRKQGRAAQAGAQKGPGGHSEDHPLPPSPCSGVGLGPPCTDAFNMALKFPIGNRRCDITPPAFAQLGLELSRRRERATLRFSQMKALQNSPRSTPRSRMAFPRNANLSIAKHTTFTTRPPWLRIRTIATRYSAALACRLPPGFIRKRLVLPLDAGIGQAPQSLASADSERIPTIDMPMLAAVLYKTNWGMCASLRSLARLPP